MKTGPYRREVTQKRKDKNKELVKKDLLFIQRIVFPDMYLRSKNKGNNYGPFQNAVLLSDKYNKEIEESMLYNIQEDDIKITTKTTGAMHMGSNKDGKIKLGVNWDYLKHQYTDNYVASLIHELCHVRYSNHLDSFYSLFADRVEDVANSKNKRAAIQSRFGNIDWDTVRMRVLNSAMEQYEGKDDIIQKLEDRLDYSSETMFAVGNHTNCNNREDKGDEMNLWDVDIPYDYDIPRHRDLLEKFSNDSDVVDIWTYEGDVVVEDGVVREGIDWVLFRKIVCINPCNVSMGDEKIFAV
jgi:hypothetical protein